MLPVELIYDEDQSVVPVNAQLELVCGHLCNARMFLLYCITFLLRISPENFWGGALDPNWTNWRKFGTRCVIELHNTEQRQTGKVSKVYGYCSLQSNLPHRCGNSRATWDHTVLPATRRRWHSCLYPSRSWYSIKRLGRDARLSWLSWLVTYWDGISAWRWSPIQVLTGLGVR